MNVCMHVRVIVCVRVCVCVCNISMFICVCACWQERKHASVCFTIRVASLALPAFGFSEGTALSALFLVYLGGIAEFSPWEMVILLPLYNLMKIVMAPTWGVLCDRWLSRRAALMTVRLIPALMLTCLWSHAQHCPP
mgnify:CR=1 FL=1